MWKPFPGELLWGQGLLVLRMLLLPSKAFTFVLVSLSGGHLRVNK